MSWLFIYFSLGIASNFFFKYGTGALDSEFNQTFDDNILHINKTNLTAVDWDTFYTFVYNFSFGKVQVREKLVQRLVDNNGVELIRDWLGSFENFSDHHDYQDKRYFGTLCVLIKEASRFPNFRNKSVSVGLLDKLLPLINFPILFDDENFSHDFLVLTMLTVLRYCKDKFTSLPIQSALRTEFGSGLKKRFKVEDSAIPKLFLVAFMALGSNLTTLSQAELNEQFFFDPTLLAVLRIYVVSSAINYENAKPMPRYNLKTSYFLFYEQITLDPIELVQYTNLLLLSESNRLELCDKQLFGLYFFAMEALFRERLDLAMYATRAIFILRQTCTDYRQFLENDNVKARKFNQLKLQESKYCNLLVSCFH